MIVFDCNVIIVILFVAHTEIVPALKHHIFPSTS
jgi:hypothetical protein